TGAGVDPNLLAQFPLAEEAVAALGLVVWPMVEFEADDALASATARFKHEAGVEQIVICSPDKDLAQLVSGSRIVGWDRRRNPHTWGLSASRAARLAESLAQHRAEALLFRTLATLREDVPLQETLADLEWQGADARLKEVCHRLGDEKFPGRVPRWRER